MTDSRLRQQLRQATGNMVASRKNAPWIAADDLDSALRRCRRHFKIAEEPLEIDGIPLRTLAIANMPESLEMMRRKGQLNDPLRDLPLWAKIWPASLILGRFLRKFNTAGKTMLEIGCGMGACSLVASRWGFKKIWATDLNAVALDFTQAHILLNSLEDVIGARRLDLLDPGPGEKYDFICASELLYLDELHHPLLDFLERSLAPGGIALFCVDSLRHKPAFERLAADAFMLRKGRIGLKTGDDQERRVYEMLIMEKP